MAGVTIHPPGEVPQSQSAAGRDETPSQRIVKAASALSYVTDADGRTLGWRKLDALEEFDLSEVAGGTNVTNAKWMLFATLAFCCREIDGQPVSRPNTKDQIRARVKLLGAGGIDALYSAMVPPEPALDDGEGEPVRPADDEMDRAKN